MMQAGFDGREEVAINATSAHAEPEADSVRFLPCGGLMLGAESAAAVIAYLVNASLLQMEQAGLSDAQADLCMKVAGAAEDLWGALEVIRGHGIDAMPTVPLGLPGSRLRQG